MGSMMSGESAAAPTLAPQFQQFLPAFNILSQQLQHMQAAPDPRMSQFEQGLIDQLNRNFNPGASVLQGLQNIAGIGGPQFLQNISNTLRPALVTQPFTEGSAALREQAALTGTLNSTGTQNSITDLLAQLEQGLGQATIGAAPGIGGLQLQAAGQQIANPLQLSQFVGGLPRALQQQGFENSLARLGAAGGAVGQLGQGLQGLSSGLYQPTTGPSKFENILATAAPIAGFAMGGPVGGAVGGKLGQSMTGGGGKGGSSGGYGNIAGNPSLISSFGG